MSNIIEIKYQWVKVHTGLWYYYKTTVFELTGLITNKSEIIASLRKLTL